MMNQQLLLVFGSVPIWSNNPPVKEKSTLVHLKYTYVFYAFLTQYGRHHIKTGCFIFSTLWWKNVHMWQIYHQVSATLLLICLRLVCLKQPTMQCSGSSYISWWLCRWSRACSILFDGVFFAVWPSGLGSLRRTLCWQRRLFSLRC